MDDNALMARILELVEPFAKKREALVTAGAQTGILTDLGVNSARLVDIVIRLEDEFDIEIDDDEVDSVQTVGDVMRVLRARVG